MSDENNKQYELSLILQADDNYPAVLSFLKSKGVAVIEESPLTRIKLAYQIKKQTSGVLTYLIIEAAPQAIKGIEHELKAAEGILRFMILTPPLKKRTERGGKILREIRSGTPRTKREVALERKEPRKEAVAISNDELEKKLEEILK